MAKTARRITNTTQRFIEIQDIQDDIVYLTGGYACLVIEVKASNFSLLSAEEQDAKLFTYAALLNSLSFSVQVVIRSKRIDITNYLEDLGEEARRTQNPLLSQQIILYRNFIQELVKVETVLDKKFYIVIPFSSLEKGVLGAKSAVKSTVDENFAAAASANLHSKAESLHSQLQRLNLKAKTLEKDDLIRVYYDIFNEQGLQPHQMFTDLAEGTTKGK